MTTDAPAKRAADLKPGDIYQTKTLGPIIVEEVKLRPPDYSGFSYAVIIGRRV